MPFLASGEPGVFSSNLDDVPYPPGDSSGSQRTGETTKDTSRKDQMFYPLSITDFGTAATTNNQGTYDSATYLSGMGLPNDVGIGMGVNGQSIFPVQKV